MHWESGDEFNRGIQSSSIRWINPNIKNIRKLGRRKVGCPGYLPSPSIDISVLLMISLDHKIKAILASSISIEKNLLYNMVMLTSCQY